MEIPLAMEVIAPSTTSTSTIGLLWTTSTWLCNVPITSATATNYNTIRLGYNQRYQSFQSCTVEYVRFSNGLTTTYPSPGGFMWAYEFNGTYANTGSESYSTTFAQGTSSLVTDGSVRGLSVPSATGANTILATIVGLNTRGASDNDGFGNWTVEVRMKFNASGASNQANVFMMGQDNTGTGAGARIGIICNHPDSNTLAISVESNQGTGYGDRYIYFPYSLLTTLAGTGAPNDGQYHTFRLARLTYTGGLVTTVLTNLFRVWYDNSEIPLNHQDVTQSHLTSSVGPGPGVHNVAIKNEWRIIRLGTINRAPHNQSTTVDYVRITNGTEVPGIPDHVTRPGFWSTTFGSDVLSQYNSTSVFPRGGTNVLVCGIVKPVSSFAAATGGVVTSPMTAPWTATNVTDSNANMVELLTVGNPSAAGSYVSVWVWRSGRILMFTGNAYTETAAAVVDTSEFVLGVHLTPTAPVLYINGATPAMTANGWRTMDNAAVATNTLVQMSAVAAERGVYLGYRRAWTSGAVINASFKNWRFVDTLAAVGGTPAMSANQIANTQMFRYANEYDSQPLEVTYGFRIDDDETLQFVKTQGSATTSTLLGKPLPASDDASGTSLTGNVLGTLTDTSLDVVLSLANKVDTSTTTSVSQLAATSATPGTQPFVAPTDEWVLWDTTLFQNVYFVWVTTVSNNATNTNYLLKLSLYVELESYRWMDGGMYMIVPYNAELLQYTGLVEDGIRGVVLSDYPNKNKLYFNSVDVPRRTASALGTREVVHLVDLNFAVRSGQFPSTPALMGLQNVGWPNIVSSVVDEFAKTRGYGSMFEPQNLPCRVVTSAQWPSFSASTNWKSVGRYDYFTVTP
eukprot:jgi/Mesvir1/10474/Mv22281-RA.1